MRIAAVMLAALGMSGCALIGASLGGDDSETRTLSTQMTVQSDPPSAEIFEQRGEEFVPRGNAPLTMTVDYEEQGGRNAGFWVGAGVGGAIDLGLTGLLAMSMDDGDNTLPIAGLVTMGLAIVLDVIFIAANGPTVDSKTVTLVARAPGKAKLTREVSVPNDVGSPVMLRLDDATRNLTAADLDAKETQAIVTNPVINSVLVLDMRVGRGLPGDIVTPVTQLTLSEVRPFVREKVIGMDDVRTMLDAEKQKDALGCDDTTCVASIGGALGTDAVLAGDVGKVGSYLVLSYRLVDSRRAQVLASTSRKLKVTGSEEDTLVAGIPEAIRELLVQVK